MKRLSLLTILCLLVPAMARADDGWWDFLWRMDPKFGGPNVDFRLCFDKDGKFENCEGLFGLPALFGKHIQRADRDKIKNELSFRFGYYFTYGDPYPGAPEDDAGLTGVKYQVFYHYHFNSTIRAGFGVGQFPIWGPGLPGDRSDLIITPVSVVVSPDKLKGIFFRGEITRIEGGLKVSTPMPVPFSPTPEWNYSIGVGYDFRR